jgi:RNA polymerase sigma-70 factor (ECF subfamily)
MAGGDRQAFAEFYDAYAALAFGVIRRIVRDPAGAEEVLQEVLWELWAAAGDYDPARGSPEAWIVNRARSRGIDRARATRRRSDMIVTGLNEETTAVPDPGGDPGARAVDRKLVSGALGRLPEAQRTVLELAYFGGLTQTEIAEQVKEPLGTVKTRMRLGLERLRGLMGTGP